MRKEERQRQLFFRMMTAGLVIAAVVMIIVTIVTVKRHKEEDDAPWSMGKAVGIRLLYIYALMATLVLVVFGMIGNWLQDFRK